VGVRHEIEIEVGDRRGIGVFKIIAIDVLIVGDGAQREVFEESRADVMIVLAAVQQQAASLRSNSNCPCTAMSSALLMSLPSTRFSM
jgi:hypothetical protein